MSQFETNWQLKFREGIMIQFETKQFPDGHSITKIQFSPWLLKVIVIGFLGLCVLGLAFVVAGIWMT
jgi:hypothetical protein